MPVKIAVLKETRANERRVALVPAVADKLIKLGCEIHMQSDAGAASRIPDSAYKNVTFAANPQGLVGDADIVVSVQPPAMDVVDAMKDGSVLLSFVYAHKEVELTKLLRDKKITCFAMELVPRISRAQAMDALSSQAALSGYYAALLGSTNLARILPMMTTAVGSIRPAKCLVMGLGVAGLQALATARRLGARCTGYDVRPETAEQVRSVGADWLELGIAAAGEGGYARALTDEERSAQQAALSAAIAGFDVVITTALVPGRPAPRLVGAEAVRGMRPGSVIVDLAGETGGNCELSEPGEVVSREGVTIAAPLNLPATVPEHASQLYARNVQALLELMIHDGRLSLDLTDEVLSGACVSRGNAIAEAVA